MLGPQSVCPEVLYSLGVAQLGLASRTVMFTCPDTLSCPIQDVQPECGGTAVVLREVHLLCPVRLPDPLWLPHPYLGQLPHQEVQPSKPLPFPGVSVVCLGIVKSSQKPLQVIPADGTLALAGFV